MDNNFERRRRFFDNLHSVSESSETDSSLANRVSCPCCGYPTLGGRGSYQICELCWWEDDGQDDVDENVTRGGPNKDFSLAEARANFAAYLVKYPPTQDTRIGGPNSEAVRDVKKELISVFDAMVSSASAESLNDLWLKARLLEKTLYRQVKRRIRETP